MNLNQKAKEMLARWRKTRIGRLMQGTSDKPPGVIAYWLKNLPESELKRFMDDVEHRQDYENKTKERKS